MNQRRGRPRGRGLGIWCSPRVLDSRVSTIVAGRDKHNEETITDVIDRLFRLARRVCARPLEPREESRLRKLAGCAKPSHITRTLVSWRFRLPDRTVRRLQQEDRAKPIKMIWQ